MTPGPPAMWGRGGPDGSPEGEGPEGRRGSGGVEWGEVEQTHSFIHSALDCGASTVCRRTQALALGLGALGFEEAQRCWLGREGSGTE